MDIIGLILIIITISSIIYHILTAYCAALFRINIILTQRRLGKIKKWPKVVCLKPLCGEDKNAFLNLVSFMRMDYPDHMLLFGIADNKDPAFEMAKSMKRYFPYQVILSIGEERSGSNRKVRNLMQMEKYLPSDTEIVIISDSDVRVEEDYIKSMVIPFLDDPQVGATTSIYKVVEDVDLPEVIESLNVETTFIPGVLLATTFAPLRYAFGASIAIRADVLREIGGFASVRDYLADDYMLARKIIDAGYKIKLAPHVVSIVPTLNSVKEAFLHALRWSRTIRICNPIGYLLSVICYPLFWGLFTCIYLDVSSFSLFLFALCAFIRAVCSALVLAWIDSDIFKAVLTPVWDMVSFFIWLWGLFGDKVTWRGREYKVLRDGRIIELG